MALSTEFFSINTPDNSLLSHCSSSLISALLVLSATNLFMKVSFSPDVIFYGCLGLKHQLTDQLQPEEVLLKERGSPRKAPQWCPPWRTAAGAPRWPARCSYTPSPCGQHKAAADSLVNYTWVKTVQPHGYRQESTTSD